MKYQVLVIGGGHAGIEAAHAAARMGRRTALLTGEIPAIGRMSCNPAIGGLAKGPLVREVDALGGLMGDLADRAGIQFKILNRSRGPAVWGPRAQCDRALYSRLARRALEETANLTLLEGMAEDFFDARGRVAGVVTSDGRRLEAEAVVVTTGTFLRGLMHTGEKKTEGGRFGEAASTGLSGGLARLGLKLGRFKTGTPPRLHRDTVDYARCEPQRGDDPPAPFSFRTEALSGRQALCWLTWTNERVHGLIRENLHRSPMYSGQIRGIGPRYCPSVEDKVVRFAEKPRHAIFLEPEGWDAEEIYVNGLSTSLPEEVQRAILAQIPGLRGRVRLFLSGAAPHDARGAGGARSLSSGADQRHLRVRGGRGAGALGGHQCRARRRGRGAVRPRPGGGLRRRDDRRPDEERAGRTVSALYLPGRVPAASRGRFGASAAPAAWPAARSRLLGGVRPCNA